MIFRGLHFFLGNVRGSIWSPEREAEWYLRIVPIYDVSEEYVLWCVDFLDWIFFWLTFLEATFFRLYIF